MAQKLKAEAEVNGETTTLVIDVGLHRKLKVRCAELGEPMRARVEGLIKDWLVKEGVRA